MAVRLTICKSSVKIDDGLGWAQLDSKPQQRWHYPTALHHLILSCVARLPAIPYFLDLPAMQNSHEPKSDGLVHVAVR